MHINTYYYYYYITIKVLYVLLELCGTVKVRSLKLNVFGPRVLTLYGPVLLSGNIHL
jgi:hypothetical protein